MWQKKKGAVTATQTLAAEQQSLQSVHAGSETYGGTDRKRGTERTAMAERSDDKRCGITP